MKRLHFIFFYYTVPNWKEIYFARIVIFWLWAVFEFVSSLTAGYNLILKGACFVMLKSTSLLVLHKINLFLLLFSMY